MTDLPKRVRHKKRGSTYQVLGTAEVQISVGDASSHAAGMNSRVLDEGDSLVVYRCEADGKLWARFPDEFMDGRFEVLPAATDEIEDLRAKLVEAHSAVVALAEGFKTSVEGGMTALRRAWAAEHKLRAIVARIEGEWDNPSLMAFGPLGDLKEDILRIARSGP